MYKAEFKDLMKFAKMKFVILVTVVVVFVLVGVIYLSFLQVPKYRSFTTVVLVTNNASNSSSSQRSVVGKVGSVSTYKQIVKSKRVIEKAIKNLRLYYSYEDIVDKVKVEALNGNEIIKISVSDEDPVLAKKISDEIANVFTEEVVDLYNVDKVNILDFADLESKPYNVHVVRQIFLYFLFGLLVGISIVFIIFCFDKNSKSIKQI